MTEFDAFTGPHAITEEVSQAISVLATEEGNPVTGDVLRRTCALGANEVCKQTCRLIREEPEASIIEQAANYKGCSDMNLLASIEGLGIVPSNVLMVSVTGDTVGFADQLDEYDVSQNPYGWRETAGFNAFFARKGEVGALGRRLADCADLNFAFKDEDGQTVFGFEHGTRSKMYGSKAYQFEYDGEPVSYTYRVLATALEHYGADPRSVHIRLAAVIGERTIAKPELIPTRYKGWAEDHFATNKTNPRWRPGDPFLPSDEWEANARGLIITDLCEAAESLGIPMTNVRFAGMIDPAKSEGKHSSERKSLGGEVRNTRDLYITYTQ